MQVFSKMKGSSFPNLAMLAALSIGLGAVSAAKGQVSQTYHGNAQTGFGGGVGDGSLTLSDPGTGIVTFTFTPGNGQTSLNGNSLVLYISTGVAGLSDTSTLTDNQDGGRTSISGNNTSSGHATVAFASGFQADFGFSLEDSSGGAYDGVFGLPPSDPNATVANLHYLTGANQGAEPIVVSVPLSTLGLTEGQKFDFVGTLTSTTAYRSDESFGDTNATDATTGNPGFASTITFSDYDTFQTPEPTSCGFIGLAAVGLMRRRRNLWRNLSDRAA